MTRGRRRCRPDGWPPQSIWRAIVLTCRCWRPGNPWGRSAPGEADGAGIVHDHCFAAHPMGWVTFRQKFDLGPLRGGLEWPGSTSRTHSMTAPPECCINRSRPWRAAAPIARRWRLHPSAILLRVSTNWVGNIDSPRATCPALSVRLADVRTARRLPATVMARSFRTEQARALFGGAPRTC